MEIHFYIFFGLLIILMIIVLIYLILLLNIIIVIVIIVAVVLCRVWQECFIFIYTCEQSFSYFVLFFFKAGVL